MEHNPSPPTHPNSPMTDGAATAAMLQRERDRQHLGVLAILYYIYGGLTALGSCAGLFYVAIGIAMAADPSFGNGSNASPPPQWLGGIMIGFGGCLVVLLLVLGALAIYAGWCLHTQQKRTFCYVIAGLSCLSIPLGTLLGIFTFIVLARPSVAALFEESGRKRNLA